MLGAIQIDALARCVLAEVRKELDMKRFKREITKEQYDRAVNDHDASDIFSQAEVMGYGVYDEHYFEEDGKYYVSFELGSSCD
jgi:predicted transcriptional regulator